MGGGGRRVHVSLHVHGRHIQLGHTAGENGRRKGLLADDADIRRIASHVLYGVAVYIGGKAGQEVWLQEDGPGGRRVSGTGRVSVELGRGPFMGLVYHARHTVWCRGRFDDFGTLVVFI